MIYRLREELMGRMPAIIERSSFAAPNVLQAFARALLFLFLLMISAAGSTRAVPLGPMIIMIGSEYGIYLTDDMNAVLRNYDPTFAHWRPGDYIPSIAQTYKYAPCQAPFAVIGDFNGDGIPDAVIDGHASKESRVIALLSQGNAFYVIEISKSRYIEPRKLAFNGGSHREYGLDRCMAIVNPQTLRSPLEKEPLVLKTDAILLSTMGKGSQILYMKDGLFAQYQMSR